MSRSPLLLAVLLAAGCGGSPTAPSTPVVATPQAEIWIISGQSNAVGCALGSGPAPVERVQMFSAGQWPPAADPLAFVLPQAGCTVGPWVWAAQQTGRAVKLTGWAQTGNPIRFWQSGGPAWDHLANAIRTSGQGARYFLWYQGETDALEGGVTGYGAQLADVIGRVRQASGNPALRAVVVGLGTAPAGMDATFSAIRQQQQQAADIYVSAEGLPTQPDAPLHLTADGYRQLGARLAAALP